MLSLPGDLALAILAPTAAARMSTDGCRTPNPELSFVLRGWPPSCADYGGICTRHRESRVVKWHSDMEGHVGRATAASHGGRKIALINDDTAGYA
jgi:hypothetical protein